ncbi:MAG: hypothetical protein QF454_06435 [Candidatus Thalassarchaeaceae archaeon]|nr:hypothetical protein [Candidatus Thalassarchaeaceae archaeon]
MSNNQPGKIGELATKREQIKAAKTSSMTNYSEGYILHVPENILNQIHDDIRNDDERLKGHLVRAIKIGLLSIEGGEFTLSTERIENVINTTSTSMVDKYQRFDESFSNDLTTLIDQKLTGKESELANRLSSAFGEQGDLKKRLDAIFDDISNPDKISSVPNRVSEVIAEKFGDIETEVTKALDLTDHDSELSQFLKKQNNTINTLKNDIDTQMAEIRTALNVDEILQQKEAEKEELYQQSTQKGHHFENDAVDSLQDIAGLFGDRIEHTGGEGVGKSRSKIGDIVIVIISPGIPEIRVAIEAKAGSSIPRKELVKQTRDGVKMRGAVCGIGLMERKHMGVRQQVVEQEAENYIVGVDWDNQDFLALEVVYRTLRAQLIAEEIRSSGNDEIDVEAVKRHLTQAKTDLGLFQSMKGGAKSAITTLEELRKNLDLVEGKVKDQLSKAEDLL